MDLNFARLLAISSKAASWLVGSVKVLGNYSSSTSKGVISKHQKYYLDIEFEDTSGGINFISEIILLAQCHKNFGDPVRIGTRVPIFTWLWGPFHSKTYPKSTLTLYHPSLLPISFNLHPTPSLIPIFIENKWPGSPTYMGPQNRRVPILTWHLF